MKVYVVVVFLENGRIDIKAVLSSREEAEKLTQELNRFYELPFVLFYERVLDKIN